MRSKMVSSNNVKNTFVPRGLEFLKAQLLENSWNPWSRFWRSQKNAWLHKTASRPGSRVPSLSSSYAAVRLGPEKQFLSPCSLMVA